MNEEDFKKVEGMVSDLIYKLKSELGYYVIISEHSLKNELADTIVDYMEG